ncbi:glycosyltransferase family 2 protein [Alistipes sp. kh20]|uniref:glycosyltransferase family 2 protein n=1 Tax=Alistipes montrealensis TaxID=2834113 RepID=UPI001BCA92D7|nr:glycosyltransferase family 2 protein [Alistipes montrealensis]MBS4767021.1 glycosyltransferase family 2 protein [Alistipes montrealensis]
MKKIKVSVIIPSYKPQNYLWECLESIQIQTMPQDEFEVILILNGCREPYSKEIESFISKYPAENLTMLQTDIPGVSNARNIGIDNAKGEFLTFIDDDDYISPTYLQELYNIAKEGITPVSNVIAFNHVTGQYERNYLTECYKHLYDKDKITIMQARSFMSVPVAKILSKNAIGLRRFDPEFKVGEDGLFMFQISNKIKILKAASPSCVYYRRNRDGSAINRLRPRGQRLKNNFKLMTSYTKYYLQDIRHYNILFYISRLIAEMISMIFAVRGKIQQ